MFQSTSGDTVKGQYLAVESVATFGMGLLVAIGTVTAFTTYEDDVVDKASERQINVVESQLMDAIHSLKDVESGHQQVDLPKRIGGSSYEVGLSNGIHIFVDGREYVKPMEQFQNYEFQGSVEGGSVKVFKRGNQFTLRAG